MKKNEMTIAKIHEKLGIMGYCVKLEVLVQMTPSELHKFYKKACKAFELRYTVEKILYQLSVKEEGGTK